MFNLKVTDLVNEKLRKLTFQLLIVEFNFRLKFINKTMLRMFVSVVYRSPGCWDSIDQW